MNGWHDEMVEHDTNPENWRAINLANWNSRVGFHEAGYGLDAFRSDPTHLSDVVRFDLPRLPQLEGLCGVHLQCHIGTDTLSLARLGARVTGLDFSAPALAAMAAITSAFRSGRKLNLTSLAQTLEVPSIALQPILDALESAGLLDTTYDLGRHVDPGHVTGDEAHPAHRPQDADRRDDRHPLGQPGLRDIVAAHGQAHEAAEHAVRADEGVAGHRGEVGLLADGAGGAGRTRRGSDAPER